MKSLQRVTIAIYLTFLYWVEKRKNKRLNQSLKKQGMDNTLDPLEEYYSSIGNHGEYVIRCTNCGLYITGKFNCEECEDTNGLAFS